MPQATGHSHTRSGRLISSSSKDPCHVCGRTHDSSCRIGTDMVLCWRGSSHNPPTWAQKPGDHGPGADGEDWAFLGDRDGWAMFRPHRPMGREERRRLPRRPVEVVPRWAGEPLWTTEPDNYRPTNWIVSALYQRHCLRMGWEVVL